MVWDIDPIIYLHPTTDKEKFLLPHRNNREEIATSTQSSPQVQRAGVARTTPTVCSDFVSLSFFFFGFQLKATRAGDEKHRKKAHGLSGKSTRPLSWAVFWELDKTLLDRISCWDTWLRKLKSATPFVLVCFIQMVLK